MARPLRRSIAARRTDHDVSDAVVVVEERQADGGAGLSHALPELVALFLPLAAWILASRRGQWHQLLAATFVTVTLAVPVLVAAAFVEVYFTPGVLRAIAG